jgi:hypothetical protein
VVSHAKYLVFQLAEVAVPRPLFAAIVEMIVAHLVERADPVRRQLLGAASCANSAYDPEDVDVPLLGWLREHHPADAGGSPHHEQAQARPPLYGIRGKNTGRR